MKPDCSHFRERLADALRGSRKAKLEPTLGELSWHAHVIHCGACRDLLSEEEALDELLRSLPQPHLPRALAERVLSRLDGARSASPVGVDLDRLLELTPVEPPPENLAGRVLAHVQLDRLLDRLPQPVAPAGLERRVLARLELARRVPAQPARKPAGPRLSPTPSTGTQFPLRIAAGFVLVGLGSWALWSALSDKTPTPPLPEIAHVTQPAEASSPQPLEPLPLAQPDEQLLASLEMFEAWDLLGGSGGLDAALATLDPLDEYLLDFEAARSKSETTPAAQDSALPGDPAPVLPSNPAQNGEKRG